MITVLEGESLVNDASGLVLYRFAVAAALTGSFSAWAAAGSFAWLAVAGVAVGLACGLAVNAGMRRLHDANAITVLSFLAAYVAYLAARRSTPPASSPWWLRPDDGRPGARDLRRPCPPPFRGGVGIRGVRAGGPGLRADRPGAARRAGPDGGEYGSLSAGLPLALAVTATCVVARLLWVFPAVYLRRLLSPRLRAREPSPNPAVPLIVGWAGMRGVVTLRGGPGAAVDFPGRDASWSRPSW